MERLYDLGGNVVLVWGQCGKRLCSARMSLYNHGIVQSSLSYHMGSYHMGQMTEGSINSRKMSQHLLYPRAWWGLHSSLNHMHLVVHPKHHTYAPYRTSRISHMCTLWYIPHITHVHLVVRPQCIQEAHVREHLLGGLPVIIYKLPGVGVLDFGRFQALRVGGR